MRKIVVLMVSLVYTISLVGCAVDTKQSLVDEKSMNQPTQMTYTPKLKDNPFIYENDHADQVKVLYLTITPSNLTKESPVIWDRLNQVRLSRSNFDQLKEFKEPKVDVILQEGTEKGPQVGMFGYESKHANASLTLRGQSALGVRQKSYKIKLFDSAGYWNDQTTINLMKHQTDLSRIRNKLSFDYFKLIPDITSFRTQFVHLYVKDLTAINPQDTYVDYGLFTQVEQPNRLYLRTHGLDPEAHLYKATYFEFFRYPEQLKLKSDPDYNQQKFESILEIKGNEDHTKLLKMLDDLNNNSLDIDEVFDRHFDRDNFFTWLAVTILFNNYDTNSQNFYLYSPLNSEKWFIIPWDYDKGWVIPNERDIEGINWQFGIANYWGMVLSNRLFKNPENVEQLNDKIRELLRIIRPEKTKEFIDEYRKVVPQFVAREPDIAFLPGTFLQFNALLDQLVTLPDEVAKLYFASLESPMPFFLGDVEEKDEKLNFIWDQSYDLQGDDLFYHFQVSKDQYFTKLVADKDNLKINSYQLDRLQQGKYYWRVIVRDDKGNKQSAFDEYYDEDGNYFLGVRDFYVDLE